MGNSTAIGASSDSCRTPPQRSALRHLCSFHSPAGSLPPDCSIQFGACSGSGACAGFLTPIHASGAFYRRTGVAAPADGALAARVSIRGALWESGWGGDGDGGGRWCVMRRT